MDWTQSLSILFLTLASSILIILIVVVVVARKLLRAITKPIINRPRRKNR